MFSIVVCIFSLLLARLLSKSLFSFSSISRSSFITFTAYWCLYCNFSSSSYDLLLPILSHSFFFADRGLQFLCTRSTQRLDLKEYLWWFPMVHVVHGKILACGKRGHWTIVHSSLAAIGLEHLIYSFMRVWWKDAWIDFA